MSSSRLWVWETPHEMIMSHPVTDRINHFIIFKFCLIHFNLKILVYNELFMRCNNPDNINKRYGIRYVDLKIKSTGSYLYCPSIVWNSHSETFVTTRGFRKRIKGCYKKPPHWINHLFATPRRDFICISWK